MAKKINSGIWLLLFIILSVTPSETLASSFKTNDSIFDKLILNDPEAALLYLHQSKNVSYNKNDQALYNENLGDWNYRLGQYDSSIFYYDLAIKDNPNSIDAHAKRQLAGFYANGTWDSNYLNELPNQEGLNEIKQWTNAFFYEKVFNDSLHVLSIKKLDPFFLKDGILLQEILIAQYDFLARLNREEAIKRISENLNHPIIKNNNEILLEVLLKKSEIYISSGECVESSTTLFNLERKDRNKNAYFKLKYDSKKGFWLRKCGKFKESLALNKSVFNKINHFDDKALYVKTAYQLAMGYHVLGEIDSSLIIALKGDSVVSMFPESNNHASLKLLIGKCYLRKNQVDRANVIFTSLVEWCENSHEREPITEVYKALAGYYLKEGDYLISLDFIKKARHNMRTYYTHFSDTSVSSISKLALTAIEKDGLSMMYEEKNNKLSKILVIAFLLLLIGVILIILFKRKEAKKKVLYQKDLKELKNQVSIAYEEVKRKNMEIEGLKQKSDTHSTIENQQDLEEQTNSIINSIEETQSWQIADMQFSKLFPKYFQKVFVLHKNFSVSEKRILMLIKLNYSNQQIADLQYVSYAAVIKSKQRIKKKLGLDKKDKLDQFLQNLQ